MNLTVWNHNSFRRDLPLKWPCPYCSNSSLQIVENKFFDEETFESKKIREEDYWEYEWITINFTGVLNCSSCRNYIMFSGIGNVEHYADFDQITGEYDEGYYTIFKPNFFQPTLNIFSIPEKCPDIIRLEIINSFRLFWFDLSSCANKIRVALELLMNEQKIKKIQLVRGKKKRLTLHQRIQEFKIRNADVAFYLEAIKWIGNTGSHKGQLEKIDIIDAYELLEHSLKKLYDNREKELKKITKEINSRRGTRKRK